MERKDIYENLCSYDKRSPYYDPENNKAKKCCWCDNCFYGRTVLALEILRLMNEPDCKDFICDTS